MLPFCGYHMSDYFAHWLDMEQRLAPTGQALPGIFCVNWFRKGADGRFVWPGYGENMRVLKWMIDRLEGRASGQEHLLGVSPRFEELDWTGSDFDPARFETVIGTDPAAWQDELKLHGELFAQLAHHLPPALARTRAQWAERLGQ